MPSIYEMTSEDGDKLRVASQELTKRFLTGKISVEEYFKQQEQFSITNEFAALAQELNADRKRPS